MGAKVSVYTTLNPPGIGNEDFMEKQEEIISLYREMGIEVTSTCTPYYGANLPKFGDHLAWSESSAVSFANSVLGARTNREGGPSSLAAAIVGKTPNYGLHLDENRKATHFVKVTFEPKNEVEYSLLGYRVGEIVENGIPYFSNLTPSLDELKALGASMAASGGVALYHVEKHTPEWRGAINDKVEKITIDSKEVEDVKERFNADWGEVDFILLGCPHASLKEVKNIAELLKMRGKPLRIPLYITISRSVKALADFLGYTEVIERYNGKLLQDVCLVVSPVKEWYSGVATNSGKAAFYFKSFGLNVKLESVEKIIMEAP